MNTKKKRPTQLEVAKLAGVSSSTVSIVLSGKSGDKIPISEDTRQRVIEAARRIGYTPDPVAQMLARGKRNLIGVFTYESIFPYEKDDLYHSIVTGIQREAGTQGYNVVLFTSQTTRAKPQIFSDGTNSLCLADGSILLGAYPDRRELLRLSDEGYPFVYVGRRDVPSCEIDWVANDHETMAREAVKFLLDLNHRRIAFVDSYPDTEFANAKAEGYQVAMVQANDGELITLPHAVLEHAGELERCLQTRHPTAVICGDSSAYRGCMSFLRELSYSVPDDISVLCLGIDNVDDSWSPRPTHFDSDLPRLGQIAVRLLLDKRSGAVSDTQHILVTCEFVEGETTRFA